MVAKVWTPPHVCLLSRARARRRASIIESTAQSQRVGCVLMAKFVQDDAIVGYRDRTVQKWVLRAEAGKQRIKIEIFGRGCIRLPLLVELTRR